MGCAVFSSPAQNTQFSLPWDWSMQYRVFPAADSVDRQSQIEKDVRYRLQQLRRNYQQIDIETSASAVDRMQRDWREAIGNTGYSEGSTYPAKYSFNVSNPTPNCAGDYIVYALASSTPSKFNLIAYNNLYVNSAGSGVCSGTTPSVLFAYNASQSAGNLSTAPVLSLDGTLIAFIENSSKAEFHVLKWKGGEYSPTFPKPYNSATLANCATNGGAAPCEYSVTYSATTATLSLPYVDYGSDTAWVTDDAGKISAIHPVFAATPSNPPKVVTGYPLTVGSGVMTAPVYDSVSGNVFVAGPTNLYYVRTTSTSAGSCAAGSPPCAGKTSQTIGSGYGTTLDAPIVDSTDGWVFAFAWNATAKGATIVQSNTTLTTLKTAQIAGSGGSSPTTLHSGTFNNAYYTNPASGLLYACGENGSGHYGALFAVSFTGSGMNTGPAAYGPLNLTSSSVSGSGAVCSPLAEVYNQTAGKDYLYTGVTSNCAFGGSSTGCVFAFDITSAFPSSALAQYSTPGGTSGIVIDNVNGSLTSATNLYFLSQEPLGSEAPCTVYTGGTNTDGNCAVKLTQSALQ